jgi:hypothetical protein
VPTRWFRIAYAENAFRRHLTDRGLVVDSLRATEALAAVAAFYRGHRAQHTNVQEEGDGLLWQWGPDADAREFTVDLTRQLVRDGDDGPIVQLSLTLCYRWTPLRRSLGRGHLWCFDPSGVKGFERDIRSSAAFRTVATAVPSGVSLRTDLL